MTTNHIDLPHTLQDEYLIFNFGLRFTALIPDSLLPPTPVALSDCPGPNSLDTH